MKTNKATKLAKVGIAKVSRVTSGTTSVTDARVSPLSQSFEVTYDANKNVLTNGTLDRIAVLEDQSLDSRITELETQIALLLSHTHSYEDDDGTIITTKTTGSN